mmetsp:Transcript_46016/g.146917  ORF Transcript_46016/g.146917 Transcript_46016/m.146917 type:complete len:146 (+) Transcript_46016:75-512(+)
MVGCCPWFRFESLTDIPMYSPLPLIYSDETNATGHAVWTSLALLDGYGCGRFKFVLVAGEIETGAIGTDAVPAEEMCFRTGYTFKITSQPPATLPLGMSISDIKSTPPISVEATVSGKPPSLLCSPNITGIEDVCPQPGSSLHMV